MSSNGFPNHDLTRTTSKPPVEATQNNDMLSGMLLEDAVLHNAIKKLHNPIDKTAFLGFMAGVWVGFGGLAALSVAGGIPVDVRARWPVLPKLGLGFFFPFALHLIILYGGELFTGNTMILSVGLFNRAVRPPKAFLNLFTVYAFNFAGCLFAAYFFGYLTELFEAEPYLSYVREIAYSKTRAHPWHNLFLRAIPANTLVCMAVMLGFSARDGAGKILAMHFPVLLFVVCGFEHSVANMLFVSVGLMYGADSSIGWMFFNQSAVVLGNAIGGALFMALSEHVMNHWESPVPFLKGHLEGTLAAHDVESSRKAKEGMPKETRFAELREREKVGLHSVMTLG
jgi:formate/nitrite transporter